MTDIFELLDRVVDDEKKDKLINETVVNSDSVDKLQDSTNNSSSNDNIKELDDNRTTINNEEVIDNQSRSFQMMVNYIKHHKTDIPEEFRGNVLVEPSSGLPLSSYWVCIMKTVPVPKWMMISPEHQDSHGWTLAQHFISVNQVEPPLYMKHNPTLKNSNGRTAAMMYLIYRNQTKYNNQDIPDWMKHSPFIFDNEGYSIIDYWLASNDGPIPSWIIEQIPDTTDFRNGNGEYIAVSYLRRANKLPPPEFAFSRDGGEDIYVGSFSYNEILQKFCDINGIENPNE